MTNKYTKHKYEEIENEDGFISAEYKNKKAPRFWDRHIDLKCPSRQSESKDEFMRNVYELIGNDLIVYPKGELESKVDINTSGKSACDLDNLLKALHDSLQGIAFSNDRQIKKISAQLNENCFMDSIHIVIKPLK